MIDLKAFYFVPDITFKNSSNIIKIVIEVQKEVSATIIYCIQVRQTEITSKYVPTNNGHYLILVLRASASNISYLREN